MEKQAKQKKKMKLWKKIVLILIAIPVIFAVVLGGLYLYADNKPDILSGYNEKIKTRGKLEAKYLKSGSFETEKYTASEEEPIKFYTVYYPKAISQNSDKKYPMILVVNGTGGKATKYEPQFELFASWGFIVVGTQDKGTGTGKTTIKTLHHMLDRNDDKNSVFYHKIDTGNIGITGFSQGGAAVFSVCSIIKQFQKIHYIQVLSGISDKKLQAKRLWPDC